MSTFGKSHCTPFAVCESYVGIKKWWGILILIYNRRGLHITRLFSLRLCASVVQNNVLRTYTIIMMMVIMIIIPYLHIIKYFQYPSYNIYIELDPRPEQQLTFIKGSFQLYKNKFAVWHTVQVWSLSSTFEKFEYGF